MPESMLSLLLEIDASAGVAIDEQRHSRNGIINLRHIYIYIDKYMGTNRKIYGVGRARPFSVSCSKRSRVG